MNIPDYTGQILRGRYQLERRIGYGGMATVYAAVDLQIDKPVAVKVLNPQFFHNQDYIARFRQEAFSAAKIRHPQLVDVTDFGHDEGLAYFVMELLEGESLSERLHRLPGPMPWTESVTIIAQVCEALAYAHDRGLIHRDVKPGNIFLVAQPGRPGQAGAKLLDLGIAKVLREALDLRAAAPDTRLSQGTPGTPEYMAPEQALGCETDHRADIYALGVTLYRMLTGHLPFYSPYSVFEVQRMHVDLPPVALRLLAPEAQIPLGVEALVLRALAKQPDERFESARQMADALLEAQRAALGPPVVEFVDVPTTSFERTRPEHPGVRRLQSVATLLCGVMITGTVFMLLMLFEIPLVKEFVESLRESQPSQPISILLDPPFQGEGPETEPIRMPVASPRVEEDVIDLFGGKAPVRPVERTNSESAGSTPAPPPLLPGPPPASDARGQAEAFVRGKLAAIARQCKDPRTAVPIVFKISYDLGSGAIKTRPAVDSMRSNCVRKALDATPGKKFGSGSIEFSVTARV